MDDTAAAELATRRTDEALRSAAITDPRPTYRALLRDLKATDLEGFEQATRKYRTELVPSVAEEQSDPLTAWLEYGRWIAQRARPGKVVAIDGSGRARPAPADAAPDGDALLLHVPGDARARAIALATPLEPTDSQRVTVELLVG